MGRFYNAKIKGLVAGKGKVKAGRKKRGLLEVGLKRFTRDSILHSEMYRVVIIGKIRSISTIFKGSQNY